MEDISATGHALVTPSVTTLDVPDGHRDTTPTGTARWREVESLVSMAGLPRNGVARRPASNPPGSAGRRPRPRHPASSTVSIGTSGRRRRSEPAGTTGVLALPARREARAVPIPVGGDPPRRRSESRGDRPIRRNRSPRHEDYATSVSSGGAGDPTPPRPRDRHRDARAGGSVRVRYGSVVPACYIRSAYFRVRFTVM